MGAGGYPLPGFVSPHHHRHGVHRRPSTLEARREPPSPDERGATVFNMTPSLAFWGLVLGLQLSPFITVSAAADGTDCPCLSQMIYDVIATDNWSSVTFIYDGDEGLLHPRCLRGSGLLLRLWAARVTVAAHQYHLSLEQEESYTHESFVLVYSNATMAVLDKASDEGMLDTTNWLLLLLEEEGQESGLPTLLRQAQLLNLFIDSNVLVATYNSCYAQVQSVYRVGPKSGPLVESIGFWNRTLGYQVTLNGSRYDRRRDFQGYPLQGIGVKVFDFFTTYLPDGHLSGFVGDVVTILKTSHNFSVDPALMWTLVRCSTCPSSTAGRLVFWLAFFMSVIVYASYSATLVSHLTVERPTALPFSDLGQLSRQSDWDAGVNRNDLFQVIASQTCLGSVTEECRVLQDVWNKVVMRSPDNIVTSYQDGLRKVLSGQYVFIGVDVTTRYYIRGLPAEDGCRIKELPGRYITGGIAIGLQHESPFRRVFDLSLQRLREMGLMNKMILKWLSVRGLCHLQTTTISAKLADVAALFILLMAGLGISLLLLVAEHMVLYVFRFSKHGNVSGKKMLVRQQTRQEVVDRKPSIDRWQHYQHK
ncbi:uncharacterized protein [Panulirus ornatus]|uniref:uncharacterized protein n=1 Tax=Panulirus ornatus TaxID=150431 RepID=UPI003A881A00